MKGKDIIFFSLIGIIILLCIWLVIHIKTEEYKCISKPFQYLAGNFETSDGSSVTCSCGTETSQTRLMFNSTTIWQNNPSVNYQGTYFNFSVATKELDKNLANK